WVSDSRGAAARPKGLTGGPGPERPGLRSRLSMTILIGILLALACALATNIGFLFKHRGVRQAPPVDMRHPLRTARSLFGVRLFAIGMGIACAAWAFHVG